MSSTTGASTHTTPGAIRLWGKTLRMYHYGSEYIIPEDAVVFVTGTLEGLVTSSFPIIDTVTIVNMY